MERVSRAAFGGPLVINILRSMVVEVMLDLALPAGWRWCSQDFAGWDFQHDDGTRLEVKQAAARQTWKAPANPSPPRFDIRARTGHWADGSTWVAGAGRQAHLYVFAHHPVTDDSADHRDPAQWVFHVVDEHRLPAAKSISLVGVRAMAAGVGYGDVAATVEAARVARSGSAVRQHRPSTAEVSPGAPPAQAR